MEKNIDQKQKKSFYRVKHALNHMCLNIEGALRSRRKITYMNHDNGFRMTDREARDHLKLFRYEGKAVLPIGDCYRFDFSGKGCLGHVISLMPNEEKMIEIENEYQLYLKK